MITMYLKLDTLLQNVYGITDLLLFPFLLQYGLVIINAPKNVMMRETRMTRKRYVDSWYCCCSSIFFSCSALLLEECRFKGIICNSLAH